MFRYFKLYSYFVRFSFSKAMEFRLDFFFRIIMDCVYYAVNMGFYSVLFGHTGKIGDWSLEQVYVFAGGYFVLDALMMTVFSTNMWWLPNLVNKGDLDYYLVKPVSSLFFLSVREFAANSFMNLVIAVGIWIWAISNYQGEWSFHILLIYILLILNGTFIYFLLQLLSILPVFWTHSAHGFTDLFYSLQSFMERPHKIFDGWLRRILMSVLPYSLMASVPAAYFFQEISYSMVIYLFSVSLIFFLLILFIWNLALKNYSSASS